MSGNIFKIAAIFGIIIKYSRTFPNESLEHDSGGTLVCAEYGYPYGSLNTDS
jgi:hypothetical protein